MNNVLIGLGVLIVAVLGALFAIPHFVDWNSYRGVIEEEASRIAGRDVRIGGGIELQLLPVPSFSIQKLRIADTATGTGEPLFRAERVEAKLSIAPLVRGVIEANEIELIKPVLHFVLDEAGRGNWRDLASGGGTMAFVPKDVALQAVKITDGTISLLDHGGSRDRLTLDHLAGLFSAPALKGPYRFTGRFGADGQQRDLRFTTLPPDGNGAVPFKALLKDIASAASATLDGRFTDSNGQPSVTGVLTAVLPRAQTATAAAKAGAGPLTPLADLKADIAADSTKFELNNLSVAFDSAGRPEVLAGGAVFSWDGELTTVAKLSTPWIDLDNVLGNPEGGNPLLALAAFAQGINGLVPGTGTTTTQLQIDQASLGHEAVSGIRIDARSSSGLLALQEVRATLPGGSSVEVQGSITGQGTATTFDGDMTLRGASLARFAGWATAGGLAIAPVNDQPFQVRSRLTIEPSRSGLRDIVATFGDSTLDGTVEYSWAERRRLRIDIAGARIDARAVAPEKLTLDALARLAVAKPSADAKDAALRPDVRVKLDTAELVLPDQTLRDVSAQVESTAKGLAIERLQFSGAHGVAVTVSGLLGAAPGGDVPLRGAVAAADREGLQRLADMIDLPAGLIPDLLVPSVVPLRLAGSLDRAAGQASGRLAVQADGQLGASDAKIKVELSGGLAGWRTAPADFDLVLLAPPNAKLAAQALRLLRREPLSAAMPGDGAAGAGEADTARITRLSIRASGVPSKGMPTAARFDSPDVTAYLHGTSTVGDTADVRIAADLTLDTRDGRDLLDDAGGLRLALAEPLTLHGQARLDAHDGALALNSIGLIAGGATEFGGHLQIDPVVKAAPRHLTGELTVSSLSVPTLLTMIEQRSGASAQDLAGAVTQASVWPQANFDFGRLAGLDLALKIKAATLALAGGISVANADLTLLARPGVMEIRELSASGLGGRVTASALLSKVPAGASMTARVDMTSTKLGIFGSTGAADAVWMLDGTGRSPAGLIAALQGSGALSLGAGDVRELTPESLQAAVDGALKAAPDQLGADLRAALAKDAARPAVALGPRSIKLAVQDGVAKTEPIVLKTHEGRISGDGTLDFSTFGLSGTWRVETRLLPPPPLPPLVSAPDHAQPDALTPVPTAPLPLPAVVERFAMRPMAGGALQSQRSPADTEALERELAVRKVERDLAELERLRRLDEARAKEAQDAAQQAEWKRQTETKATGVPEPQPVPRPTPAQN